MSNTKLHFELIAAKAKLMAEKRNPWTQEIINSVMEIQKSCNEILQETRSHYGGDR